MAHVDVALAVVRRGDAVLLQQRDREPFKGQWELPGGKVERGETPEQAALREAHEELGVDVVRARFLTTHEHRYAGGPWVRLHAFDIVTASPVRDAPHRRWVALRDVAAMDVLAGTRPVLAGLSDPS